jgi:hypothetical protein
MLLDELKRIHSDMLTTMYDHIDFDTDAQHYLYLFDTCFEMADVIVTMQNSDLYINDYAVKEKADLYTLREIHSMCKTHNRDDVISWVRGSAYGGRLQSALKDIADYWETPDGIMDILKDPTFKLNLADMTR